MPTPQYELFATAAITPAQLLPWLFKRGKRKYPLGGARGTVMMWCHREGASSVPGEHTVKPHV